MTAQYTGGCLCGAVRYEASAEPINQRICHCRFCQRAIGAAFNARLLFHAADVSLSGALASVRSTPDMERLFCAACGTTIGSRRTSAATIGVTSGTLDDPVLFVPTCHIYAAYKQAWVVLADGLPQYDQASPAS